MTEEKFERISLDNVDVNEFNVFGYPQEWFKKTLTEAEKKGFSGYSGKWENRFSKLFFSGGTFQINKDLDEEYAKKLVHIFKSVAGSFQPKHEHKTCVCAYLLRSLEE